MKTVNARGVVFGEGRPKVMTSLCGSDAAGMIKQARFAKALPVDVLEWRIDFLDEAYDIDSIVDCRAKAPCRSGRGYTYSHDIPHRERRVGKSPWSPRCMPTSTSRSPKAASSI